MSQNFLQPRAPDMRGSNTQNTAELHKDDFCVDRKKLEQMLSGDNEAPLPADIFFQQIMSDTNTVIAWPNKMEIGATSMRDPYVMVKGSVDDVLRAKERILTVLDPRSSRVTIEMEVIYTDVHIIGDGGMRIRRVIEETQCRVYFPDSLDKSNQVSISGDIQSVELARSRVRQNTPVIFGFELPIMSQIVDPLGRYIVEIQKQYVVHVVLKTRPHATLLQVKGVEWEIEQAKKATTLLVEYVYEYSANQIPIEMTMEISPIHHAMVIGKNHQNIKEIMQLTDTQILFPDAFPDDLNIPITENSSVAIFGNINNVYAARQSLIGSLPLLLIFDLPGNPNIYKSEKLMDVQTKYDVHIRVQDKSFSNSMLCIIKGHERNATNIYRARKMILQLEEPADIPASYHMPLQPSSHNLLTPTPLAQNSTSPLSSGAMCSTRITPSRKEQDDEVWNFPPSPAQLSTSNFMDHTLWSGYDLPAVLRSIGCAKYIRLLCQSMDLAKFASVNEKDLITLGVNSIGCRRRMLLAIAELNKRDGSFSAAPGASQSHH